MCFLKGSKVIIMASHFTYFLSASRPSLQVSAGDNKVLTLPVNTVSLYASAWPKETAGSYFM